MSYYFFLGSTMLPVPPAKLSTKIKGKNKTINLINEGEVNLIKDPGLSEISFSFLLPNSKYPFANYDTSLQSGLVNYAVGKFAPRLGGLLGNSFSFKKASTFLNALKTAKEKRSPTRFIVTRMGFDYRPLWNTNMLCTIEDYEIGEDAGNGTDVEIDIVLKQYKHFGTKEVEVTKNEDGTETLHVKENRYAPDADLPAAMTVTNELSVLEVCEGLAGGKLDWRAAANMSGITNPLEMNLKGKVVKFV